MTDKATLLKEIAEAGREAEQAIRACQERLAAERDALIRRLFEDKG